MQIVIEIPDEYRELFEKEKCKEKFDSLCTNEFGYVLRKAFESGIVLPKGHGGLVDRKMVHKAVMDELWGTGNARQTLLVVDSEFYVTTIIPADKEGD